MITLHGVPHSRSFRVAWMLHELGLPFEQVSYSIRDGSLRAPDVLRRTPAGRVPALDLGDETLFESGAIVQVLAERHPESGLHRAPEHPERGRYLSAIHYAETMASLIEQLNLNHVFLRPPAKPSAVVIKLNTARLKGTLAGMEAMLGDQDYLLPSGFSAADVMMGFNLHAAPFYVKLDPFPALQAYVARISARPAYRAALAAEGPQDFYDRDFYPVPED